MNSYLRIMLLIWVLLYPVVWLVMTPVILIWARYSTEPYWDAVREHFRLTTTTWRNMGDQMFLSD